LKRSENATSIWKHKGLAPEGAVSVVQTGKKLPASVETQFLQDVRSTVNRIRELIDSDTNSRVLIDERKLVRLLKLALSLESTFAVWCWCHVHLERVSPGPPARISLRLRAEAAMQDADHIAERLHQVTGTSEFRVDWLPSARQPVAGEQWTFNSAVCEDIALTADRMIFDCYKKLLDYVKKHDTGTAALIQEIATARRHRIEMHANKTVAS
jgi:hypothetical protein